MATTVHNLLGKKEVQIPGVAPVILTQDDLTDPQLLKVNEVIRQIFSSLNSLIGAHGQIPFTNDIDMQGHSILNAILTAASATLTGAAPTVGAGQVGLGSGTAATATAGAGTLPANPDGFLLINIGGSIKKIAFYKP
jgi:hypothetical protein